MLNRLKKNDKKGFTLVELIVVLVILAILAALLIPALTGYIDKARNQQIIAETRQTVMAAQTLVDEAYASKDLGTAPTVSETGDVKPSDIKALAEVDGTIGTVSVEATETPTGSGIYQVVISTLEYSKNGKKCTYKAAPASGEEKYTVATVTP